ncbi:LacI family transcriptional regulator [Jannaschia pagri]|uniref:LacI family transcriptional regulator n=1 Tax=Jannaschia pagri TaxID=2829797 RepID=A0ABQ4NJD4_9RHOB|nr:MULTISPECIES: LacI family DNA-binding transcriptional regulator [unclassified Jannaschia]GIT89588.1 LacI family transcriptional regulator [Jannaschia sp. AI_61]GIT94304.1 LacI family transcriptional regulator [Jannaschia sp. AI_62]
MQRNARMKDVAQAAGVSVMTVSRAFKKDASVKPATRAAIIKVADELGYVYDSTAANLRSQKTDFVAVLIPSLNNANFADTVGAMTPVLSEHGLQILLGYTNYDIHEEEYLVEQLLKRRPEAIVLTGGRHTDRTRRLLTAAGIPVVETWDLPEDPVDRVVGFSNAETMGTMVDHLVAQGHQRIAFIGGDTDGDTRGADRRRGFLAAMAAHGLETSRLIGAGTPPISMREGAEAMGRLLEEHPDTDAVVCVSDLSAFGALTECARRGLSVPGDIAVAGFGAYEIADICVPRLTTIDPHPARIGQEAARMIVALLAGAGAERRVAVEPALTAAESTVRV